MNNLFANYGNTGNDVAGLHWAAGDGISSVALPDGNTAWFFADTYLGKVAPTGHIVKKPTDFVHNSIVIQDGNTLTQTLYYANHGKKPLAFISPSPKLNALTALNFGYWPVSESVSGNTLNVVYTEERFTRGPFHFTYLKTVVASFSLPDFQLLSVVPSTASTSSDVYELHNTFVAVTMAPDGKIDASYSCGATGPFSNEQLIYTTPEQQQYPAQDGIITYGATIQYALNSNTLLVTYDVNPINLPLVKNSKLYRPKFLDVTLGQ